MINVPVIARRELRAYFLSPIAYVILTGFALTHGLLFSIQVGTGAVDPNALMRFGFWVGCALMVVGAPIISMRLISQENRDGTIEPLLTAPVSETDVVLGKFAAALLFGISLTIPILLEFLFLSATGSLDYGPIATGFVGLYLLTAQFLAVGLMVSALTRVQLAAAIITFVTLVGVFLTWILIRGHTSSAARVIRYLAPAPHFRSFVKGIIDTREVTYFIATTVLFLFLAVRVVECKRGK